MKLGFGLYKHMLNEAHYKFAKQCGATHLVIHLVDYFGHEKNDKRNSHHSGAVDRRGGSLRVHLGQPRRVAGRLRPGQWTDRSGAGQDRTDDRRTRCTGCGGRGQPGRLGRSPGRDGHRRTLRST